MNRQIAFAIAAALALAGAVSAQDRPAPTPGTPGGLGTSLPGTVNPQATDPGTATPSTVGPPATMPHRRSTAGVDHSRSADTADGPTRVASASDISAGMPVQTASGELLGTVRDVVPNASGEPGYVLITKPQGGKTAVPYTTVRAMTLNGSVVLDRARLDGAPPVKDSQLQDRSDTSWQRRADEYWNGRGSTHSTPPARGSRPDEE